MRSTTLDNMANRNTLRVENDTLTIIPKRLDRVWCFQKEVVVPLAAITSVAVDPHPHKVRRGLRFPGTDAYWKICGTYHPNGERHFWNYAGTKEALTIRLDGTQSFDQIYLSVSDAEQSRRVLSAKLSSLTGGNLDSSTSH